MVYLTARQGCSKRPSLLFRKPGKLVQAHQQQDPLNMLSKTRSKMVLVSTSHFQIILELPHEDSSYHDCLHTLDAKLTSRNQGGNQTVNEVGKSKEVQPKRRIHLNPEEIDQKDY